jgi:hypothetical protein
MDIEQVCCPQITKKRFLTTDEKRMMQM